MITLIGAFLGFFGSILPELLKLLKGWQDNRHELAVMNLQIEAQKSAAQTRLEEIGVVADIAETQALHRPQTLIGIRWVDAMIGSVRPVITYAFFFAYVGVKIAQYHILADADTLPWIAEANRAQEWFQIFVALWNDEDKALFATVMAHWFGDRSMTKRRAGR